ncbi:hypothetical protein [Photobacterium leiognathi]|uniref:hypothetical protein n=1 Tax=Photobacterium leiognathi TaxID=553611 RepID=UPI00298123F9|nr:hypothetical protein [Photobacterium leiognathi]
MKIEDLDMVLDTLNDVEKTVAKLVAASLVKNICSGSVDGIQLLLGQVAGRQLSFQDVLINVREVMGEMNQVERKVVPVMDQHAIEVALLQSRTKAMFGGEGYNGDGTLNLLVGLCDYLEKLPNFLEVVTEMELSTEYHITAEILLEKVYSDRDDVFAVKQGSTWRLLQNAGLMKV